MKRLLINLLHSERASSLVELALVLPLLLLLILGVIDLGRGFRTYSALATAAQEGARWLATHPTDVAGAQARVVAEAGEAGLQAGDITISITPAKSSYQAGESVTFTVAHTYMLMFGAFTSIPTMPMNAQVMMKILYG